MQSACQDTLSSHAMLLVGPGIFGTASSSVRADAEQRRLHSEGHVAGPERAGLPQWVSASGRKIGKGQA